MAITDICCDHHHGHQETAFWNRLPQSLDVAFKSKGVLKKFGECAKCSYHLNPVLTWQEKSRHCNDTAYRKYRCMRETLSGEAPSRCKSQCSEETLKSSGIHSNLVVILQTGLRRHKTFGDFLLLIINIISASASGIQFFLGACTGIYTKTTNRLRVNSGWGNHRFISKSFHSSYFIHVIFIYNQSYISIIVLELF
jgi:hypothetical protein